MHRNGSLPKTLWLILAVALALRLTGAWRANLIFDERAHWAMAETICFQPGQIHLVSRTLDHPLMSIYVLKCSSLLLGTSDFALRIPYVLAGTLTVLSVYFLGRRVFGSSAGLWAAALLAVDQFHASWSRVFMPEVLMLLFGSLVLLQFLRTLEKDTLRHYVLLGVLLALAYLAKEPAILLVPVLWIYLLVTPRHRRLLLRPRWYLAQGVFLLVVAPDVIWNLCQLGESYLYRDAVLATGPWRLSMKSFSLYLGEAFCVLIGADVLEIDYQQGNVYVCHWVAGVLYLVGVAAAATRWKSPEVRLMLVAFLFVFGVFFVLPGGERFEPFWWASLSLIPAVVCAGGLLGLRKGDDSNLPERPVRCFAQIGLIPFFLVLLLGYLGVRYVPVAWRTGPYQPRASVDQFVADFLREGNIALEEGRLREARRRFIYVLNIGGPNDDAYSGLAKTRRASGLER